VPPASTQPKRIVLLTRDGLEHRYVANALCDACELEAIVVDTAQRRGTWRRAWRQSPAHFAARTGRAVFLRAIADATRRRHALEAVFRGDPGLARPELVRKVDGINGEATKRLLDDIAPDAILVYGTGIVRDHILTRATGIALNMHTGISPYYRGTNCAQWPIINGEPEKLGATVHECTSDLDGGRIFATGHAAIEPDDGLHHAFARAVVLGAGLYWSVVRDYLDGTLRGEPQDLTQGREYRSAQLTLTAELRGRLAIRRGLLRRYAMANNTASSSVSHLPA